MARSCASGRSSAYDKEIEIAPGVFFPAWTYNGRVPGPTLRANEGDLLRIHFVNAGSHPHTMHFHGIHSAYHDGVAGIGRGDVEVGDTHTYEFTAKPFGVHLYHCHASPLKRHMHKGLYGAFIVNPIRPSAATQAKERHPDHAESQKWQEFVMVMNAFDTNFDSANEVYAINSVAFHHMKHPIVIDKTRPVRVYLVNVIEFDLLNSFHLHANFFDYYDTGTTLEPTLRTVDTDPQVQAQRGILEFTLRRARGRALHVPRPRRRVHRAGLDGRVRRPLRRDRRRSRSHAMSEITADEVPGTPIERPSLLHAPAERRPGPDPGPAPDRGAGRDHPHRWRPGRSHPAADRDPQRAAGDPAGAGRDHGQGRQRRPRRGHDRPGAGRRRLLELHHRITPAPLERLESATLTIPYPWVQDEAHAIALVSSTGAIFEAEIPVAFESPEADRGSVARFGLVGLYVGVIPVALGLLWYPVLRRLGRRGMAFVLALTVGLLAFLVVDMWGEAQEVALDGRRRASTRRC